MPKKTGKKAGKAIPKASAKKPVQKLLGTLRFDKDLDSYTGSCRLDGKKVPVTLDASEESVDVATLTQLAEKVLTTWPKLHTELCQLARAEIISARLPAAKVPLLKRQDVIPFSFSISADSEGEVYYGFGLNVPSVLDDDEYVDVSREVNGAWTNSEVCCTE